MADKVCIKKGCNWTRTHGYFCQKHKVVVAIRVHPSLRCAANFCSVVRAPGTMFCDKHKKAMDRERGYTQAHTIRAPLPDRRPVEESSERDFKPAPEKLVVKWDSDHRCYEATCGSTHVTGHGDSPGQAIRNWHFWWDCPF